MDWGSSSGCYNKQPHGGDKLHKQHYSRALCVASHPFSDNVFQMSKTKSKINKNNSISWRMRCTQIWANEMEDLDPDGAINDSPCSFVYCKSNTPPVKQFWGIIKYLHNPGSTFVTGGQLLCIPQGRPELRPRCFHTPEPRWFIRVTYKHHRENSFFVYDNAFLFTRTLSFKARNLFSDLKWQFMEAVNNKQGRYLSRESPEAPWTKLTVE